MVEKEEGSTHSQAGVRVRTEMLTSGTTFLPVASPLSIRALAPPLLGAPIPLIKPSLLVLSK